MTTIYHHDHLPFFERTKNHEPESLLDQQLSFRGLESVLYLRVMPSMYYPPLNSKEAFLQSPHFGMYLSSDTLIHPETNAAVL